MIGLDVDNMYNDMSGRSQILYLLVQADKVEKNLHILFWSMNFESNTRPPSG